MPGRDMDYYVHLELLPTHKPGQRNARSFK